MLACRLPWGVRQRRALVVLALLAALVAPGGIGRAAVSSRADLKQVSYLGYRFAVPRSWPVINLADHKLTCVRFDQHAVYLGSPGRNQSCPSWLIGTTEAMLIQPGPAKSKRSSVENPVSQQITVTARRIRITATFDNDPTVLYRILASAKLPTPVIRVPNMAAVKAARRRQPPMRPRAHRAGHRRTADGTVDGTARRVTAGGPDLPADVTSYHGLGFDSCTAPSAAYMRAWRRRSPYRAVGVYIGGRERACAQPNLTPGWLRRESAAGWRFIPMYVGPQAEFGQLRAPVRQGMAAATDAVVQAERLGFPARTPLYYDMESYPARDTGIALRFLSAWTWTLHVLGYSSGVYSSSLSGVQDLARQYFRGRFAMPDVIYDALWNGRRNTGDPVLRASEWGDHQRVHQYSGNVRQRFGGDAIDIDQDYLNVRVQSAAGTPQASPAVTQQDGAVDVFYRGPRDGLWYVRSGPVVGWEHPVDLGGTLESAPTAVYPAPGVLDVFYKGPGGDLWQVTRRPDGAWTRPEQLGMGVIGSAPTAVATANGVVDVFWKGSTDAHLWAAQFRPGAGWSGPQRIGGSLAFAPSPVAAAPGNVEVFWTGTDHRLWYSTLGQDGSWGSPVRLGTAAPGGQPAAMAEATGVIDVFWRAAGAGQLWDASYQPGHGWSRAGQLGGDGSGAAVPLASAAGRARVFFRGRRGRLMQVVQAGSGSWLAPARIRSSRRLGPTLFAAIGGNPVTADLFWSSRSGTLWSITLGSGGDWTKPRNLHGRIG
jgi:Domain of unknown function (DUF1906)